MHSLRPWFAVLALALVGCQKKEQSSIEPEGHAASASATASAQPAPTTAASGVPGPLVPYADGKAPSASPSAEPKASADPAAEGTGDERTKPAPASSATAKAPSADATEEPDVVLLSPGSPPHEKLRFEPEKGSSENVEMTMTMAVGMEMGPRKVPKQSLPPMVMGMRLDVTEVEPDGDIRYTFELTDTDVRLPADADPRAAGPMKKALGKMKGLSGYAVVSSRGINEEAKVDLPENVDPQTKQVMQGMEQAMNQIGAPLPAEPVGEGAKWRHTSTIEQNGIRVEQVATYDLVELEDGTARCKVKVTQSAPPQTVPAPGGVRMKLSGLSTEGGGKTVFKLDQLAPERSRLQLRTAATMAARGKTMKLDTDMTIEMKSR